MWYDDVPVDEHLIPIPSFGEPNFYRWGARWETFRKRNNTDLYKRTLAAHKPGGVYIPPPIRASVKDKDDWDWDRQHLIDCLLKHNQPIPNEPDWIKHDNMLEFFEAVGYDDKAHRWIRPEDREAHFLAKVGSQMDLVARNFANDAKRYCIRR
jgi:hypothetical protein